MKKKMPALPDKPSKLEIFIDGKAVYAADLTTKVETPSNSCEHGDHPAPIGKRFCSEECERCEESDEYDPSVQDCSGLCQNRWKFSGELDALPLGTAEEERARAKLWMEQSGLNGSNADYWHRRTGLAQKLVQDLDAFIDEKTPVQLSDVSPGLHERVSQMLCREAANSAKLGPMLDCTGKTIDYAELDPGIREVVRRLREAGFDSFDSGDGVSKPEEERWIPEPHVFSHCTPENMRNEARRLAHLVGSWNVTVEHSVEASYDASDDSAVLIVIGIGDAHLPMKN